MVRLLHVSSWSENKMFVKPTAVLIDIGGARYLLDMLKKDNCAGFKFLYLFGEGESVEMMVNPLRPVRIVAARQQKDEENNEVLHNALWVQCPRQKTPWRRGGGASVIQGGKLHCPNPVTNKVSS